MGEKHVVIFRRRSSPFIKQFASTPDGIVCPHFWMLSHANGCQYNCAYCYLKHTMRDSLTEEGKPAPVVFTNHGDMKDQLIKWAEETEKPSLLNTGELSDSFLNTKYLDVLFKSLAFNRAFRKRHVALFLTKGAENVVESLEPYPVLSNFIVSFSVSTNAGLYEMDAPPVLDRIRAAKTLREKGWRIRLRIDPLIPQRIAGKPVDSDREIAAIADANPEIITLGSLRFSWNWNYNNMLKSAASESDGCGVRGGAFKTRIPVREREEIYQSVINALREFGYRENIGLCKETMRLFEYFGLDPHRPLCNCSVEHD